MDLDHIFIGKLKREPVFFKGKHIITKVTSEGGIFIPPVETDPTIGEHDFHVCEGCQNYLVQVTKNLTEKFHGTKKVKGFPFCCQHHSNLIKLDIFKREDFEHVPGMVARKVIYTFNHIKNNIKNEDYYKSITDYIEYTIRSFGQMPDKCGEPLYRSNYYTILEDLIAKTAPDTNERRNKLLAYVRALKNPTEVKELDLKILIATYEKWLELFPFELNFFSKLKEKFEKQLPFIDGKIEVNQFTGEAKAQIHTKDSLFEALISLTNKLLVETNIKTLNDKNLLGDIDQLKLELIQQSRSLKLKLGYTDNSDSEERRFGRMIMQWYNDEKQYFEEIRPFLKDQEVQSKPAKNDQLRVRLVEHGFLKLSKVSVLSEVAKEKVLQLLSENDIPYKIAMLDLLGYIDFLKQNYFPNNSILSKHLSKWFNTVERTIKGNINVLITSSTENRQRYTAHKYKQQVKKDYNQLK